MKITEVVLKRFIANVNVACFYAHRMQLLFLLNCISSWSILKENVFIYHELKQKKKIILLTSIFEQVNFDLFYKKVHNF